MEWRTGVPGVLPPFGVENDSAASVFFFSPHSVVSVCNTFTKTAKGWLGVPRFASVSGFEKEVLYSEVLHSSATSSTGDELLLYFCCTRAVCTTVICCCSLKEE